MTVPDARRPRRGRSFVGPLCGRFTHPADGLRPSDLEKLHESVDAGNTVVVVEHDMHVIAGSDPVIDIGPGAGEESGRVVAVGQAVKSHTAPYLTRELG